MTRDVAVLLVLIVLGAAWLLQHFALLRRALSSGELSLALRLLALVPPLTPVIGWRAGARGHCTLWLLAALAYLLALRFS